MKMKSASCQRAYQIANDVTFSRILETIAVTVLCPGWPNYRQAGRLPCGALLVAELPHFFRIHRVARARP